MASISFKMPDDFLLTVSSLTDKTDEIVPRVLESGGNVVLDKVRSNLQGVIGKNTKVESRSTGELVSALGLSPAEMNRRGVWDVKIGFREPRPDGESNAKIANILEYGRHGQPPKPFLKPARAASKAACEQVMREKLTEEINSI